MTLNRRILIGCIFLMHFSNLPSARSDTFDASIAPRNDDNFYEARTRLWIPDQVKKINGILVLLNGTDSDARASVENPDWQEFARKERLALIGCYFRGDGEPYEDAKGGSGDALLEMIRLLAEQSGRGDLRDARLLFVGHSAGAMFSFNFTCWKPKKVLSFVLIKSGPINSTSNGEAAKVTGLFIIGESDLPCRVQSAATAFSDARTQFDARWALAVEPNGGHGSSSTVATLARTYLQDALALLLKEGTSTDQIDLYVSLGKPLDAITSNNPDKSDTAWLPGHTSKMMWSRFVKPISLHEIAANGGIEERKALATNPTFLDLGQIDVRERRNDVQKTFLVSIPDIDNGKCRFFTDDKRMEVAYEKKSADQFTVSLRVATEWLKSGFFRSRVGIETDTMGRTFLPVVGKIRTNYRAKPASLYVGVLPRGAVSEMNVTLLSESGEAMKVSGIKSSNPGFAQARVEDSGKISCHFDGKQNLGNQSGYFEVSHPGSGESELRIPFIAWVSKRSMNE